MKGSGQLHAPWGKQAQSPLIRKLGVFESHTGCHGEGNNLLLLPEIKTQFLGSPANTLSHYTNCTIPVTYIYINSSTCKIQARALSRKTFLIMMCYNKHGIYF